MLNLLFLYIVHLNVFNNVSMYYKHMAENIEQYIQDMKTFFANPSVPDEKGYRGMNYIKNTLFKWLCINHGKASDTMYDIVINNDVKHNQECYNVFITNDIVKGINTIDTAIEFIYNVFYSMYSTHYVNTLSFAQMNTIYKTIYENYNELGYNKVMIINTSLKLFLFVLYGYSKIVDKVFNNNMPTNWLNKQVVIDMLTKTEEDKKVFTINITQPINLHLEIDLVHKTNIYDQLKTQFKKQPKQPKQEKPKPKKTKEVNYRNMLLNRLQIELPIQHYTKDDYDILYKMLFWLMRINDGDLNMCCNVFTTNDIDKNKQLYNEHYEAYTEELARIYNTKDIYNMKIFMSILYDVYNVIYNKHEYDKVITSDAFFKLFNYVVYNTMRHNRYNTNLLNLFLNGIAVFNSTLSHITNTYPTHEIVAINKTLFNYDDFANNIIGVHFVVSTKSNDKVEFDINIQCVIFGKPTMKLNKQFETLRHIILKGLYGEDVFTMKLFDENDYDIVLKALYYAFIDTSNKIMAKDIVAFDENIEGFNKYLADIKHAYDNYDLNTVSVILFNEFDERLNKIVSTSLSDKNIVKKNVIDEATANYINIIVSIFGDIMLQSFLYNNNLDIKNVFVNGVFIIRKLINKMYNVDRDIINEKRLIGKEIKKKSIQFTYTTDGENVSNISIGFGELYKATTKNDHVLQYQQEAQKSILPFLSTINDPKNALIEEYAMNVMQNVDKRYIITPTEQTYMCKMMMNIMYNIYFISRGKTDGDINNLVDLNKCMYKQYINWFTLCVLTAYLDINKQLLFLYRCFFDCIKYMYYNTYSSCITPNVLISMVNTLMKIYTYKHYGVNAFVNIIYIISVIFQYYLPLDHIDEFIPSATLRVNFEGDKAVFMILTNEYEDIIFDIAKSEILMYPEQVNDEEQANRQHTDAPHIEYTNKKQIVIDRK